MDPGFWRHAGRREEPWEEIPLLVLHCHRFVPVFLPFATRTQSRSGKNPWDKIPSECVQENPGSAEPLPFNPGKFCKFRSARGGKARKIHFSPGNSVFSCFSLSQGIFGVPKFSSHGDFCIPEDFRMLRFGDDAKPLQLKPFPNQTKKSLAVRIWDRN